MQCAVKVMKPDFQMIWEATLATILLMVARVAVICHDCCNQIGCVPGFTAGVLLRAEECLICLCDPW